MPDASVRVYSSTAWPSGVFPKGALETPARPKNDAAGEMEAANAAQARPGAYALQLGRQQRQIAPAVGPVVLVHLAQQAVESGDEACRLRRCAGELDQETMPSRFGRGLGEYRADVKVHHRGAARVRGGGD